MGLKKNNMKKALGHLQAIHAELWSKHQDLVTAEHKYIALSRRALEAKAELEACKSKIPWPKFLTEKEEKCLEVYYMRQSGLTYQQICGRIGVMPSTASYYASQGEWLMRKISRCPALLRSKQKNNPPL